MTYISTQSLTTPMRQSVMQMQSSLAQAQQEISTGVHADLGLSLGAKTGTSITLKSQIDNLGTYQASNSLTSIRLSSTQTTLSTLLTSAQSMSSALLTASTAGGLTSSLTQQAQGALKGLVSGLNTSAGDQYVFGGINTDKAPVADYFGTSSAAKSAVDSAFQTKFSTTQDSTAAGSISGSDMSSFLDNQFATLFDSSNWQSNWSQASDTTMTSTIAPSQTMSTSVSGNQSAFRQMAQAYTMLTEFTGSNLSDGAKSAVVAKASSLVSSALASLNNLQSGVGVAQAAIETADTQSTAQVTMLSSTVGDLENVDPYALSAKVSALQTQLESSYELTSRLQKLSLTNYLG